MKLIHRPLFILTVLCLAAAAAAAPNGNQDIQSRVLRTEADELVLVQEVLVEAPVAEVWKAYTTAEGWMGWAVPLAEVDFRIGGTIRTHYGSGAKIGDPGTITLHIVNYVPERLLTLQAELSEHWPEVMQEDAEHLMNVIVFEAMGENRTRVLSYGVGYRDQPAYEKLMDFFIGANEGLFQKLKDYLETGGE